MAGGLRSKTDSADAGSIKIGEIAAALRNLDKRAGIGELSGTETLQAAGAFKQELIRAWLKSVGNEQFVSQYDNVTETIAEGVSSFGALLNKRLEETGKEKGWSSKEIADAKYVATAAVAGVTAVVAMGKTGVKDKWVRVPSSLQD